MKNQDIDFGIRLKKDSLVTNSRGFHLKNTHVNDSERIKRLLAVLAIAFCWEYRVGEMQNELTPIKLKKHQRPVKSLFRVGLDWLSERLSK